MAQSLDKFKATFREEAFELLTQLEDKLLELGIATSRRRDLNAAFRAIHTIKGSAAMFGFDAVSDFAHEMETVLDLCRAGTLAITKDVIGLALKGRDSCAGSWNSRTAFRRISSGRDESLLLKFREFSKKAPSPSPRARPRARSAGRAESARAEGLEARTYRVSFRPSRDIFKNGTKVLNLDRGTRRARPGRRLSPHGGHPAPRLDGVRSLLCLVGNPRSRLPRTRTRSGTSSYSWRTSRSSSIVPVRESDEGETKRLGDILRGSRRPVRRGPSRGARVAEEARRGARREAIRSPSPRWNRRSSSRSI